MTTAPPIKPQFVVRAAACQPYAANIPSNKGETLSEHPGPPQIAPGAYLGRRVDRIGEDAPVPPVGNCVVDSAMADGIREMAVAGYGVGWLPDCCATAAHKSLVAIDGDKWTMTLLVVADRD